MQPALEANDVTVQIKACGLSRIDIKVGATSLPAVNVTLCVSLFHADSIAGGSKRGPDPSRERDIGSGHKR